MEPDPVQSRILIGRLKSQNGNFSLLYVMKMSLRREWLVLKSLKTPLRIIKMVPSFQICWCLKN